MFYSGCFACSGEGVAGEIHGPALPLTLPPSCLWYAVQAAGRLFLSFDFLTCFETLDSCLCFSFLKLGYNLGCGGRPSGWGKCGVEVVPASGHPQATPSSFHSGPYRASLFSLCFPIHITKKNKAVKTGVRVGSLTLKSLEKQGQPCPAELPTLYPGSVCPWALRCRCDLFPLEADTLSPLSALL